MLQCSNLFSIGNANTVTRKTGAPRWVTGARVVTMRW
jgi:hypothetical protein